MNIVLISISILQIYIEYNLRENTIKNELITIQNLFGPALTQSLWDVNMSQTIASCSSEYLINIDVEDTGCGIKEKDIDKVFIAFEQ